MDPAPVSTTAHDSLTFEDGLGQRHRVMAPGRSEPVEMLCLRGELTSVPSFEFALRERVSRTASFKHACYAQVQSVERLKDKSSTLALVSEYKPGVRLSELLTFAERQQVTLDIDAAGCLLRQLVPAVAMLHQNAPDISHGALAAERIVVTPDGRVVVVEHVLGSALEQLRFSHERYWKDLRLALPRSAGLARFDHKADVAQIGVVALALIVNRPIADDEYPARIGEVVSSAWAISARGGLEPLPAGLRSWLMRSLQLDARHSFQSATEAQEDLERVLGESDYLATPSTLQAFLGQYQEAMGPVVMPEPVAVPAPVPTPIAVYTPAPQPRVAEPAPPPAPVAIQPSAPPTPTFVHTPAPPAPIVVQAPAPPIVHTPPPASMPHAPQQAARKEFTMPPVVEQTPGHRLPPPSRQGRPRWQLAVAAVALIAVAGAGVAAARRYSAPPAAASNDGTLVVNTNPTGAHVFVDGVERGVAPLTVTLNAGTHSMEVRGEGAPRVMPVTIAAGGQVAQYIDLPKGAATLGQLQVRTEPAGARVTVDGVARGAAPLIVSDLAPGEHAVLVESDLGSVKQTVTVEAGITASLTVPLGAAEGAPVSGWISLVASADVQVFEKGKLLGSSQTDRLMVSAGKHEFEIVNETLGYRVTRVVQVTPGKVTPIKIDFPKGTIALNAIPWAEVWVDGAKAGDTPIGNLELTIGSHEIVFRNPELGEQRHAVTITLDKPSRLSVDLRKK
jgi:hypothetical protein